MVVYNVTSYDIIYIVFQELPRPQVSSKKENLKGKGRKDRPKDKSKTFQTVKIFLLQIQKRCRQ